MSTSELPILLPLMVTDELFEIMKDMTVDPLNLFPFTGFESDYGDDQCTQFIS